VTGARQENAPRGSAPRAGWSGRKGACPAGLERGDPAAEGWLRRAHRDRRAPEIAVLVEADGELQQAQFNHAEIVSIHA